MNKIKIYLVIYFFILLSFQTWAIAESFNTCGKGEISDKYKMYENRCEGRIEPTISGEDLRAVSFTAYMEPLKKDTHLKVLYFLPKNYEVDTIIASEVVDNKHYEMEAIKPNNNNGQWNYFGGQPPDDVWPTKAVIDDLFDLPTDNLGVIVKLKANAPKKLKYHGRCGQSSDETTLAPAFVFHDSQPKFIGSYILTFNIAILFSEYSRYCISSYDADAKNSEECKPIPHGGNRLNVELELKGRPEGLHQVVICGKIYNSTASIIERYIFYHNPKLDVTSTTESK